MKKWISHNLLYIAGAVTGGIGGFLYWKYVGCLSGTCTITSSPRNSTLYFALMGALLFGMFRRSKSKPAEDDPSRTPD